MFRTLKRMLTRPRRLPGGSAPLWQVIAMVTFGWGGFAFILGFVPTYSPVALWLGIAVCAVTVVAFATISLELWPERVLLHWFKRVFISNSWLFLVLGIGIRAWTALVPEWFWGWVALFGGMCLFAWAFPALYPRLSARLYREQMYPETPLGRGCLTVAWFLFPLGPSLGIYLPRYGYGNLRLLLAGVLFTVVAIGGVQAFAHQLWRRRPWAQAEPSAEREG